MKQMYRIYHQDGESVSLLADSPRAAAIEAASFLYARYAHPLLTNRRRMSLDDRIVCEEESLDMAIRDILPHPYEAFCIDG